MPFTLKIPKSDNTELSLTVDVGQCIFVLGANGTGKSSLMHRFFSQNNGSSIRISAHRQTWFSSNAVTLSPEQKRNTASNIQNTDMQATARWKDDYAAQRASMAIYELIEGENTRARSIATAVDTEDFLLAKTLSQEQSPIKVINELLRISNIPIEISIHKDGQVLAKKIGGDAYSIAELSDGERNALLIAANVLTAPAGKLILIDEPERHLHRSIISPLLTLLFSKRSDCAFVISTHDVMLPFDHPTSQTILVRSCSYLAQLAKSWEIDVITSNSNIDEALMLDILGARRKLIFVEGEESSLDKSLYSLIFPGVTVLPKSSCRDVEQAIIGIRSAAELHWLSAFGIVDSDRRTLDDIERLSAKGIYTLPAYSIESLYYHPEIQRMVATRCAEFTGDDPVSLLDDARNAALTAMEPHIHRMSSRAVEKVIRDEINNHWPRQREISAGDTVNITINIADIVAQETQELRQAIDDKNLEKIICRYPIRETPILNEIAKKIGFLNREKYENAVRKLLMDDANALDFIKTLFGTLVVEVAGE